MLYHAAVLLLFALVSIVYANKRIAGGTLAVDGQFPHMVSMLIYYEGAEFPFICSGGILTKNIILTAAHCTFEETLRPKYIDIYYGSAHNEAPQAKTAAISYLSSHPNFNKDGKTENDIALIRLNEDLVFDIKTKPMQLASEAPTVEDVLTIAGRGRTPVSDPPADLLYVDLQVRPDSECEAFFDSYGHVPNTQVCAEGGPKDSKLLIQDN
jgi:secreted trypsin-like serine protease